MLGRGMSQNFSVLPFITIIIPARNEESNIEKCVLSLLSQSYPSEKFKIIVVDDNSTDGTAQIVSSIMEQNPNVRPHTANPPYDHHPHREAQDMEARVGPTLIDG